MGIQTPTYEKVEYIVHSEVVAWLSRFMQHTVSVGTPFDITYYVAIFWVQGLSC